MQADVAPRATLMLNSPDMSGKKTSKKPGKSDFIRQEPSEMVANGKAERRTLSGGRCATAADPRGSVRDLTSWDKLQTLIGTTSEGADLDFKEALDPSRGSAGHIECAKGVAALANVLGGHLLLGVSTEMG